MPDEHDPADEDAGEIENVRVVVRVRPMDKMERESGSENCIKVDKTNRSVTVYKSTAANTSEPPKLYYFDNVFGEESTQIDLYVDTARPIVNKVLEGYNGTILAYGQTGTGKTYTMSGVADSPQTKGIIPNTFAHIFGHIAKAKDNQKFLVRVSYMEIYNEEVRDLLSKKLKSLEVKERSDIGVYVKDLSGYVVHNADDLENIMKLGNKNRVVGATKMNLESSRSHAIFSITIESSEKNEKGEEHVKMGKLHLVDLAGSERQSKTQATGIRLKEATKINLSLSVLGNVISALVDGKCTHIPYRNSKLTRLLQDSLGGNSKTVMCASISPADSNYVETISTLRYAGRAKSIQNRTHINEEPKDALLRHFQEEIDELRRQLEEGAAVELTASGEDDDDDVDEDDIDNDGTDKELMLKKLSVKGKKKKKGPDDGIEKTDAEKELFERCQIENEKELKLAKTEQEQLLAKLQSLENKILVGGENLLDKAQTQEELIETTIAELEEHERNEQELKDTIQKKEAERIDIEERYSSLQEECVGKTKKLHRVMQMLMSIKSELADEQQEEQREKEGIYESIRTLSRELALCELVINSYIPKEYQNMIESFTHWNEDIGDWQLKCVAYTGNNNHKPIDEKKTLTRDPEYIDLSHVYLNYTKDSLGDPVRGGGESSSKTSVTPNRPRTSGVPRPTTARGDRKSGYRPAY